MIRAQDGIKQNPPRKVPSNNSERKSIKRWINLRNHIRKGLAKHNFQAQRANRKLYISQQKKSKSGSQHVVDEGWEWKREKKDKKKDRSFWRVLQFETEKRAEEKGKLMIVFKFHFNNIKDVSQNLSVLDSWQWKGYRNDSWKRDAGGKKTRIARYRQHESMLLCVRIDIRSFQNPFRKPIFSNFPRRSKKIGVFWKFSFRLVIYRLKSNFLS